MSTRSEPSLCLPWNCQGLTLPRLSLVLGNGKQNEHAMACSRCSTCSHQDDRVQNARHRRRSNDSREDDAVRRSVYVEQLCRRVRVVRDDRDVQDTER